MFYKITCQHCGELEEFANRPSQKYCRTGQGHVPKCFNEEVDRNRKAGRDFVCLGCGKPGKSYTGNREIHDDPECVNMRGRELYRIQYVDRASEDPEVLLEEWDEVIEEAASVHTPAGQIRSEIVELKRKFKQERGEAHAAQEG